MPKRTDIKESYGDRLGPIVIGQAAEFDYAGTQACPAPQEEGYEVILVNSNPATIMTDTDIADWKITTVTYGSAPIMDSPVIIRQRIASLTIPYRMV